MKYEGVNMNDAKERGIDAKQKQQNYTLES